MVYFNKYFIYLYNKHRSRWINSANNMEFISFGKIESLSIYILIIVVFLIFYILYDTLKLIRYIITNHPEKYFKLMELGISIILMIFFSALLIEYK